MKAYKPLSHNLIKCALLSLLTFNAYRHEYYTGAHVINSFKDNIPIPGLRVVLKNKSYVPNSVAFIGNHCYRPNIQLGHPQLRESEYNHSDLVNPTNFKRFTLKLLNSDNESISTIKGVKIDKSHFSIKSTDTQSTNLLATDKTSHELTSFSYENVKPLLNNLGTLFLWYTGTILYNVENKKALNMCPLPKTIAALQMYVGLPLLLTRWLFGLKTTPKFYLERSYVADIKPTDDTLSKITKRVANGLYYVKDCIKTYKSVLIQSVYFSLLHALSVTALSAGAVGFVHVIKASEPIFASVLSLITGSSTISPLKFLSLIPIASGVAISSMKEMNFSAVALGASLISNIFSSIKRIEAKKFFNQDLSKIGENITPSNVFSLMTIFSTIFLTPLAFMEYDRWSAVYNLIIRKYGQAGVAILLKRILLSGFYYALYNEVSFIALSQLSPITHAVANTVKRIFLIMTSVVIFNAKLTLKGLYGSVMSIIGAMLYSLVK